MIEYFIVFVLLVLTGVGLSVPEESVLLLAAYLAATGSNLVLLVFAAVLAIAIADSIQYARGRFKSRLFKQFKPGKQLIHTAGFFAVFTSRFFIASRVVMPYMAGALQMPRLKFHLASILSALISSFLIIFVGAWIYGWLALVANAALWWMLLVIVVTGVLVMYATRNQVKLAKE